MKSIIITVAVVIAVNVIHSDQGFAWSNNFALIDQEIAISTDVDLNPLEPLQLSFSSLNGNFHFTVNIPEKSSKAILNIYTLQGKQVAGFNLKTDVLRQTLTWYGIDFNCNRVSHGLYLVNLETDTQNLSKHILYMRP